MSYNRN